jgi:hypothetical protein
MSLIKEVLPPPPPRRRKAPPGKLLTVWEPLVYTQFTILHVFLISHVREIFHEITVIILQDTSDNGRAVQVSSDLNCWLESRLVYKHIFPLYILYFGSGYLASSNGKSNAWNVKLNRKLYTCN